MDCKTTIGSPTAWQIERRGYPRVAIELLCRISSGGKRGSKHVGTTLNISRRGALIRWESATVKLPPLGAALVLEFELPVNRFGRRLMRCRGRVVRICAAEKQFPQLALAINQMDFRDTSPGAVELPEPDGFEQVLM